MNARQRRRVLNILQYHYLEELRLATQFMKHAEKALYPQYRQRLEKLSEEDRRHAELLRERILALGGQLPPPPQSVEEAGTQWELVVKDLQAEKDLRQRLLDDAYAIDQDDPETARLLLDIRTQEKEHRDALTDMLMKLSCYED